MKKGWFLSIMIFIILSSFQIHAQSPSYDDYQKQMEQKQKEIEDQIQKNIEESIKKTQEDIQKQVEQQQQNLSSGIQKDIKESIESKSKWLYPVVILIVISILAGFIIRAYSFGKRLKDKKAFSEVKGELAVIMFTDMKGFSKQVGKHEQETLDVVWGYEKIMRNLIMKHGGKVIKTIGDAVMATFKSAVHAVDCAKQIQEALKDEKLRIRIGLHLGEITGKEGDVYGHNVNIASRIEGKAPPGGIAVSEDVYKQVSKKVNYKFRSIGVEKLKNIKEPVKLYKLI